MSKLVVALFFTTEETDSVVGFVENFSESDRRRAVSRNLSDFFIMKQIADLQRQIEQLTAETPMLLSGETKEIKASNRLRNKNLKEIDFLRTLIKYLESGAQEDFVKKEADRVGKILETHRIRMESHINTTDSKLISTWKKEYETEYGLGKLKTQYKTLEYLLG